MQKANPWKTKALEILMKFTGLILIRKKSFHSSLKITKAISSTKPVMPPVIEPRTAPLPTTYSE
ncbi:Uncharacterised protein [Chlamydia trachomatis]|nr:Uncharacterised protein [Chlamydia trachomatis]